MSFKFKYIFVVALFGLLHTFVLLADQPTSIYSSWQNKHSRNVSFQENKGQFKGSDGKAIPDVLFKSELNGVSVFITTNGLTYLFTKAERKKIGEVSVLPNTKSDSISYFYSRFDIDLKNSEIKKENILKEGVSRTDYNFFYPHCKQGINSVKEYERITIKEVYQGIDWVVYGSDETGLKYDFIVHPGADPGQIKLLYKSLNELVFDNGAINVKFLSGSFSENAPECFLQKTNSKIKSSFSVKNMSKKNFKNNSFFETEIGFNIDNYPKNETLIIDPLQQWWGTYFGGNDGTEGVSVTTDSAENLFVLGSTNSLNMPVQPYGSLAYFQGTYGGSMNGGGLGDIFILKFTNAGQLLWATYFGGTNIDRGASIKCDKLGNIFVLGETYSFDLPLKNPGGGAYYDTINGTSNWLTDFFIGKFSNAGQYLWGTYYGGDDYEHAYEFSNGISIDINNDVYFTGSSTSLNFPLYNPGGGAFFQASFGGGFGNLDDAVILKFSNTGQRLYATYYGGSDQDVSYSTDCDALGNVYFCGKSASPNLFTLNPGGSAFFQGSLLSVGGNYNGFLLKLNSNCQPIWSTYIGTTTGVCSSLICDKAGDVFMTGSFSNGFPTVNPGGGAFFLSNSLITNMVIAKFTSSSQMIWATYFGTWVISGFPSLTLGSCEEVYASLGIEAYCASCPPMQVTNPGNGAYCDSTYNDSLHMALPDAFLAGFTNSGILKWGTYFGGAGNDQVLHITCDKSGNLFYTGDQGWDYYQTPALLQTYTSGCIKNPGGGAYFQPVPTSTTFPYGSGFYCVVGKFINPHPNVGLTTSGCNNTDTIFAQPFPGWGPYTYTWSTGANTSSINNIPAGNYTCSITDGLFGCREDQSIYFGAPSVSVIVSSSVSAFCFGQSITLNAQGANSYSWSPSLGLNSTTANSVIASPSITTTYSLIGSTPSGCTGNSTITLTVNPLPVINISGLDSICKGSASTLFSSGTNNYTWTPGVGLNTTTGSSVIANPSQTQIYTVIGKDANGCIDSAKFNLKVIANPTLQVAGTFSFCSGQSELLTFQGANQYTLTSGLTNFNGNQATISPTTSTTYTLTGTNNGICKNSITIKTSVWPSPTLTLSVSNDTACAGDEIYLQCNSAGNISWYPSSGLNCTQCSAPMAIFGNNIKYYVTVTDGNNCSNKDSISIFSKTDCLEELIIPNVFTPNYDNVNDVFKITALGIKEFYISIYDRWGLKLFESDKIHNSWDGTTTSGISLSSGTYFYIIKASGYSGKEFNLKGYVELIR